MPDDLLSVHYEIRLPGSYDCVDRVVVNAYFSLGHNPEGFQEWWRRLFGSEDHLNNTHLKSGVHLRSQRYPIAEKITLQKERPEILVVDIEVVMVDVDPLLPIIGTCCLACGRRTSGLSPRPRQ